MVNSNKIKKYRIYLDGGDEYDEICADTIKQRKKKDGHSLSFYENGRFKAFYPAKINNGYEELIEIQSSGENIE